MNSSRAVGIRGTLNSYLNSSRAVGVRGSSYDVAVIQWLSHVWSNNFYNVVIKIV